MSIRFLTLPGLASSGPEHWQTIWERRHPDQFKRVEQINWDWPVKTDWVKMLQQEIDSLEVSVVIVAHSLGCITVAHWAAEHVSPYVAGAMLVAPADAELSKRLAFVEGFTPIPRFRLPFPSIVVASTNDIYAHMDRSLEFAGWWGSEFVNLGETGHINAVSGLGEWQQGKDILMALTKSNQRKTS
jgi:uncharacterized protein